MNIPRGKYIRLDKALYGLEQAARQWNMDINTYILDVGLSVWCMTLVCMYEVVC